jgi:hypothetical protein
MKTVGAVFPHIRRPNSDFIWAAGSDLSWSEGGGNTEKGARE